MSDNRQGGRRRVIEKKEIACKDTSRKERREGTTFAFYPGGRERGIVTPGNEKKKNSAAVIRGVKIIRAREGRKGILLRRRPLRKKKVPREGVAIIVFN